MIVITAVRQKLNRSENDQILVKRSPCIDMGIIDVNNVECSSTSRTQVQ